MENKKYCLFLILIFVLFSTSCLSTTALSKSYGYTQFENYGNMYIKKDEFQDISFIRHGETFYSKPFYIYISKTENEKFLRSYFYYQGSNWIFFDKAYLINGKGDRLVISFNSWDKKETIHSAGNLSESIDVYLSNEQIEILRKVLTGINVRLRLSGEYSKEYKFSQNYIDALKQTLYMYDFL